jgi:predicted XRE-type DNA-binding protein
MSMTNADIVASIGNVFADLGLPDAQDRLAKAELARKIGTIIHDRHLTQSGAAEILGVDQPKVSALVTGRLSGFSFERLIHFLTLLGQDVAITVTDTSPARPVGQLTVSLSERRNP